jgi:hypothetical protein
VGIKEVTCFACGLPINEMGFPPSRRWPMHDDKVISNKVYVMCSNCSHVEQTEEDSDEIVK